MNRLRLLAALAVLCSCSSAAAQMPAGGEATLRNAGATASVGTKLIVTSPAFVENGRLPVEFSCDGAGVSPPIAWSGAPSKTQWFAISLWHTATDREKSYWVVYDIPADVTKLEKDNRTVGRMGHNDKRRAAYEPMCPKGTKLNTYHITVFALSAKPRLPTDGVTRAILLDAIKGITLAEGTLNFQHQRAPKE